MRRLFPRTLAAWVLLILVAMLLASQTVLFVILSRSQIAASQEIDLYRLNERVLRLAELTWTLSPSERIEISSEAGDSTTLVRVSDLPAVTSQASADNTLSELEGLLTGRLERFDVGKVRVQLHAPQTLVDSRAPATAVSPQEGELESGLSEVNQAFSTAPRYTVSLQFKDGQWLNLVVVATPTGRLLSFDSLPWYLMLSVGLLSLAFWAVWRLTWPYQLLESALSRLGNDLHAPPLPERGSKDYRSAAKSLNEMQASLLQHVEQREILAAALAHDLRTPITRMHLRLALLRRGDLKVALARDLTQIERTVQSVVDFATLSVKAEPTERLDFRSFVDSLVDDYEAATLIGTSPQDERLICDVPPIALGRCIKNLIENAVKYGAKASLAISSSEEDIVLTITDEGPGIPEPERDNVFKPFVRLDNSRNPRGGGSGLGLTIARAIVRKLGGKIDLSTAETGGLCARLTVPRV